MRLAPSLLALVAVAPCAMALDITQSDESLKLGLSLQLQVRAVVSQAKTSAGNPGDIQSGAANVKPDQADFYIRRARFGFNGTYDGNTKFALVLTSDKLDQNGTTSPRTLEVYNAWVGQEFKGEKLTHAVRFGLMNMFFNSSANVYSSTTTLLPTVRSTEQTIALAPRVVGVEYKLTAPYVTWGADIGNNVGDSANANGAGYKGTNGEGLVYTTRAQITPEGDWKIATAKETFMGQKGKGVLLGLEAGENQIDNLGGGISKNTTAVGADLLVHVDGLTALAEARYAKARTYGAASTIVGSDFYIVQAGYALPCPMVPANTVEPALRFQRINANNAVKEVVDYGTNSDYGASGYEWDVGVNYYFKSKANNKLSLQYTNWRAESGDARANVGMAQYQLFF